MALSPGQLPQFGPSSRLPCQALIASVRVSDYILCCIDAMLLCTLCVFPQLTSLPESGTNSAQRDIFFADLPVTSPAKPEVNITCRRTLNESTGLITAHLEWSYEYNPLIQEAISMYTLTYRLEPEGPLGSISNLDPSNSSQVSGNWLLSCIVMWYISLEGSELIHLQTT